MRIRNLNLSVVSSLFLSLLLLISCQKEIDIDLENPPPVPGEIQDSTLLIKSIKLTVYDPASGLAYDDSIKEDYFYDTINKKIILTVDHAASHPDYFGFLGIEHVYNNHGLLTNIVYKYRDGFIPDNDHPVSVKLDYDGNKVLQKLTTTNYNGEIRTILFGKTSLSSEKYELKWTEPLFGLSAVGSGDTANVRAVFDKEGKCIESEYSYSYKISIGGPDETYTKIILKDSLIYDATGSVSKIIINRIDTARHEDDTFVGCEFLSRNTKGDQLYNLQQILLSGIANIPLGEDAVRGGISGILSHFPDGYEPKEYSRYPFQVAKVYDPSAMQYDTFMAESEFGSKGRLEKFKGFLNDFELFPYVYEISYYK